MKSIFVFHVFPNPYTRLKHPVMSLRGGPTASKDHSVENKFMVVEGQKLILMARNRQRFTSFKIGRIYSKVVLISYVDTPIIVPYVGEQSDVPLLGVDETRPGYAQSAPKEGTPSHAANSFRYF